ncbi:hypothetical protein [Natroniella sp. ANB-PHB2]|uniref:hypothetical protein n=1 Tax=Natroniella sp. ANB-PHB2 TaxID=3384444 RepID=UPI0038D431EE
MIKIGDGVTTLLQLDGKIVAAEQGNLFVTSFHPELDQDLTVHQYFIKKVNR